MSFTAQVKEELARAHPACENCEKAELAALVRLVGTLTISAKSPRIEACTETACVARHLIQLLHGVYGLKTELTVRRSKLHKAHNFLITVPAQYGLKEALQDLGLLGISSPEQSLSISKNSSLSANLATDLAGSSATSSTAGSSGESSDASPKLSSETVISSFNIEALQTSCCAGAFLRGVFLAGGYLADPKGNFHFELVCQNEELADAIAQLMNKYDIAAKQTRRYNMHVVYLKSAEPIITFLSLVSAPNAALVLERARMVKSLRNDTNRKVNAEIANQKKTSVASFKQIMQINHLIQTCGLDSIPKNLQDIALLRLRYPDASIKELGELADPPLSKNAVYHRLCRIQKLAKIR